MIELFAPPEYWQLSEKERQQFDCGPDRGILTAIVPDSLWGCDIRSCCAIHDFMYTQGKTDSDKTDADTVFLNNMIRCISAYGGRPWTIKRRLKLAKIYYEAVVHYGGPSFWEGKNQPSEMGNV